MCCIDKIYTFHWPCLWYTDSIYELYMWMTWLTFLQYHHRVGRLVLQSPACSSPTGSDRGLNSTHNPHTHTHTHAHTHRAVVVIRDESAIKQGEIRSRARDARENLRIQFAILFLPHIPCQQIALNWIALIQGSVSGCITEEQMEYFQWEGRKILEKRAKMEWPGGKKKKKSMNNSVNDRKGEIPLSSELALIKPAGCPLIDASITSSLQSKVVAFSCYLPKETHTGTQWRRKLSSSVPAVHRW